MALVVPCGAPCGPSALTPGRCCWEGPRQPTPQLSWASQSGFHREEMSSGDGPGPSTSAQTFLLPSPGHHLRPVCQAQDGAFPGLLAGTSFVLYVRSSRIYLLAQRMGRNSCLVIEESQLCVQMRRDDGIPSPAWLRVPGTLGIYLAFQGPGQRNRGHLDSGLLPHRWWSWVSDGVCDDDVLIGKLCGELGSQVWPHGWMARGPVSPFLHTASNQADVLD